MAILLNLKFIRALASLFLLLPFTAFAINIDKIVVFGDSLTDNGNLYSFTSTAHKVTSRIPIIPKKPPYYEGRFSNGPVWIEYLAKAMKLNVGSDKQFIDYALGGSWAEPYSDSHEIYPFDFATEVGHYLRAALFDYHKDKHLYVIWVGGNDYLSGRDNLEYATTNTTTVIKSQIERLIHAGVKQLLVLNLPDLSLTPWAIAQGPDFTQKLFKLTQLHNAKLHNVVADVQKQHKDVKLVLFDVVSQFNDLFSNPEKYHLKDIKNACYTGSNALRLSMVNQQDLQAAKEANLDIANNASLSAAYAPEALFNTDLCTNPNDYLFWDAVHPTTGVHEIIANSVFETLKANGINGEG